MWWRLSLLGLIGCLSLSLAPFERLVPEAPMDPTLLRLLAVIQPALLVLLAVALGLWAAPKVGLDAPLVRARAEKRSGLPELRQQAMPAILGGLAVAAVLVAFWSYVRLQPAAAPLLTIEFPLATKLLYGGIVEELLLRWGMMSLFAWIAWRLVRKPVPVPAWCLWTAIVASALLFAVGHLPALFLIAPDAPDSLVAIVVAANALPGLLFGWLFWRRGLEAAMIAHASAHLFGTMAIALIS
jgi:hypothetical protein